MIEEMAVFILSCQGVCHHEAGHDLFPMHVA